MILQEDEAESMLYPSSKRHIFVLLVTLKHLCVHPFILLHSFCNLIPITILVDSNFEQEEESVDQTLIDKEIENAIDSENEAPLEEGKNDQDKALAARLHLRYIKKRVEELYHLKEPKDWMKVSNKVQVIFELLA